jgi:hypothetical protein
MLSNDGLLYAVYLYTTVSLIEAQRLTKTQYLVSLHRSIVRNRRVWEDMESSFVPFTSEEVGAHELSHA